MAEPIPEKEIEGAYELPEGWVWTNIQSTLDLKMGQSPPGKSYNTIGEGLPLLNGPTEFGLIHPTPAQWTTCITKTCNVGDILLCVRGSTTGRMNWADQKYCIGRGISALSIIEELGNRNYYYLYIEMKTDEIIGKTRGSTFPNLSKDQLNSLPIPLPPLAEQRRITAKLEALLAQVNAAKDHLAAVPPIIKRFRQSVLAAACSGRLTEDWRRERPDVEPANELLERIREGRVRKYEDERKRAKEEGGKKPKKDYKFIIEDNFSIPSWVGAKLENLIYIAGRIGWRGLKAEEYTKGGPLLLSVHNLNYGEEVDFRESNHISMERYDESPEIKLQENDILLAKDGAGIGKIGIVKNLSQLTTVNSSLLVIRSREAFVPKYLFYFLSGPQLQNIVQQRITGSATPHLFQKDFFRRILNNLFFPYRPSSNNAPSSTESKPSSAAPAKSKNTSPLQPHTQTVSPNPSSQKRFVASLCRRILMTSQRPFCWNGSEKREQN